MIKITYKGVEVEVNSVEEAVQFAKSTVNLMEVKINRVDLSEKEEVTFHAPLLRRKKGRNGKRMKWTTYEVNHLIEMVGRGLTTQNIAKNGFLRQRHPKTSIESIVSMVKYGNGFGTASKLVVDAIKKYNDEKLSDSRTIPVQHM